LESTGIEFFPKMEVYSPAEDSLMFANFLEKYLKKSKQFSYLDMGTGSGILSEVASKFLDNENILAVDINPRAVKLVMKKGFKAVKSNLFEKINNKFDLITFNAPYLPEDLREPKDSQAATTGGKQGDEISLKFLKGAKKHLKENGKILLLTSSLTPMERIKQLHPKIVDRKKIFFEELRILEFS
jgi:release factor glutamine methyltransferase